MFAALECISPEKDSISIIDQLKTGNLPPQEILFEEMSVDKMGDQKVRTLGRKKSRQNNCNQHLNTLNQNLFQRKRELTKKIEHQEGQISKGIKPNILFRLKYNYFRAKGDQSTTAHGSNIQTKSKVW